MTYKLGQNIVVNVKDLPYSARGDGVTDDSAAISAANTTAFASGATLFFPAGTYNIASNLVLTAYVSMAPGAILSPNAANVTLNGPLAHDHRAQQLFSGTGFNTSVSHTGGGPPSAVTTSGSPLGTFAVQVVITTGGIIGVAQFKYTLNGLTFFAGFSVASTFVIPGTGITLHFANSVYMLNDTYSFTAFAPITLASHLTPPANPIWWGALGDNTNDDTNAIQSAIHASPTLGAVFIPQGVYKITQTLILTDLAMHMYGVTGGQTVGTQIIWHGADGTKTMVQAVNISESSFENLSFQGSIDSIHGCTYCFWIEEPIGIFAGGSTEDVVFSKCCFLAAVGPGSACFAMGRFESGDIAQIRFLQCEFTGGVAGTAAPTTVTAATNATPIQITTSTPHNLIEHQAAVVRGVLGNTAANVGAFVHIIDSLNFQLIGTVGNGTYGGGGTVYGGGSFVGSPGDSLFTGGAVGTCENGVLLNCQGNEKNYSFINCQWRSFLKSGVYAVGNSGSLLFIHPIFGFSFGINGLVADFHVQALQNLTVIGAESEGSARAVYGIGSQNPGICNLVGYNWNGYGVDYEGDPTIGGGAGLDVAVYWNGQLIMNGCLFVNFRLNLTAVPYICVVADPVPVGVEGFIGTASLSSFGNYFSNATFLPFFDGNPLTGGNNLVEWQDFAKGDDGYNQVGIISRGDLGGDVNLGRPLHFPSYDGSDLRVGPQQLWVQLSQIPTPNFAKVNAGILTGSTAKISVDFTDIQTGSASRRFTLARFPTRCRIISVIAKTTIAWGWASGSDTISLSVGLTQANGGAFNVFNDTILLLSHDIKTAPVTKGLVTGDLGADLAPAANNAFGWVDPDTWLFPLPLNAVFTSGAQNLSGLNAGHTDFYIRFEILPL